MQIVKSQIKKLDINILQSHVHPKDTITLMRDGEPYQLLAYLSTLINYGLLIDIGTYRGLSAVALGFNPTNLVWSYDIQKFDILCTLPNVQFFIHNLVDNMFPVSHAQLIHIDVLPHNGEQEDLFIKSLVKNHFQGIVVLDDINYKDWPELRRWWNQFDLDIPKYDLTDVGHFSGTGLLDFSRQVVINE